MVLITWCYLLHFAANHIIDREKLFLIKLLAVIMVTNVVLDMVLWTSDSLFPLMNYGAVYKLNEWLIDWLTQELETY